MAQVFKPRGYPRNKRIADRIVRRYKADAVYKRNVYISTYTGESIPTNPYSGGTLPITPRDWEALPWFLLRDLGDGTVEVYRYEAGVHKLRNSHPPIDTFDKLRQVAIFEGIWDDNDHPD
jgi:hypothetical protein